MNKKLTARVQKLNPAIKDQEKSFSFGIVIEPEDRELAVVKGSIYAVFNISSDFVFDTDVVSKVIYDVLHDSYYATESSSPIQSLEKAISTVKDKVFALQQDASIAESKTEFNAFVSVLWGNVLYVVQYGDGFGYLMRGNEIKPIQTSGEGNYSFSSGIVKEDDVVILSTSTFTKKFPPEILLSKAISVKDLGTNDCCLLLKFIVDTSYSESEIKNIATSAAVTTKGVENMLEKMVDKIQAFSVAKDEDTTLVVAKPKILIKSSIFLNKKFAIISSGVLASLLMAYGVYFIFSNKLIDFSKFGKKPQPTQQKEVAKIEEKEVEKVQTDDTSKDTELAITRIGVKNTLFDLVISDKTINPQEIDIYNNKLYVTDPAAGKLFYSAIYEYKFAPITEIFHGIGGLVISTEGNILFGYDNGIKDYSIKDGSVISTYETKRSGDLGVFGKFVYSFDGAKLLRYSTDKGRLDPTTWAESEDFNNAKKLQIAYSIYVATSDNRVVKYTTGKKDDFELTDLTTPLGDIVDFVVKQDFTNIYIADKTNKRIVVVDLTGKFVKQYKFTDTEGWKDLKALAVDDKESKLFVLSGTKLYEIPLQK